VARKVDPHGPTECCPDQGCAFGVAPRSCDYRLPGDSASRNSPRSPLAT